METPTTRTDRAAEASAEAERRYPESWDHYNDEPVDDWGYSECQREAFCAGMAWADANPKPHTITTRAHGQLVESLIGGTVGDHIGGLANLDHLDAEGIVESILRDLGIEVEDDDE